MSLWCTCRKAPDGFRQIEGDLWGCSRCSLPTRKVFEVITGMRMPHGAVALLSEHGQADGIHRLVWRVTDGSKVETLTYFPYPRKIGMQEQAEYLYKMWSALDTEVNKILDAQTIDREYHKARARAFCEIIAMLMSPFYDGADAVGQEAMLRHERWTKGESQCTPGLGEEHWNPNTRWDGTPYDTRKVATPKPVKAGKVLNDQEKLFVTTTLKAGTLTAEVMAGMFKVSVADIEACRDAG